MNLIRSLNIEALLKQKSHFLFGPRSTGKSTLIRSQLDGVRVYDLLNDEVFERLLKRPTLLEEELKSKDKIIAIDEIQRLPKLLNEVHRLIEKHKIKFLLTGSSARKLKRNDSNLLGGRAWEANLFPLTSDELKSQFDLMKYLNRGGLPHVYLSEHPQEELKAYIGLYLKEEIIAEGVVRKVEDFLRFLDVFALNNGEELAYQSLSSDSGVQAKTIQNYIQILEDTLFGFQVMPFLKTKKRKAITRSKFYFFDLGVINRLVKRSEIVEGSELFGKAFEHFLMREIKSYLSYARSDHDLMYWRSANSEFEVDAVVGDAAAIEFKASKMVHQNHLRGLKALSEEKLIKNYYIISQDSTERTLNGVQVLPWNIFLKKMWSGKLF